MLDFDECAETANVFKTASKYFDAKKHQDLILKWSDALRSYNTPLNFTDHTELKKTDICFDGKKYPFIYIISKNFDQRRHLMANGKKYEPVHEFESYDIDLDFENCYLCEATTQGIDSSRLNDTSLNNIIEDLGDYCIIPNKFPSHVLHSLFIVKAHDDMTNRVIPVKEESSIIYTPEKGKTKGNIITLDYLESVIESCDKLGYLGLRNHALENMSLPDHEHFHFMFAELPFGEVAREVAREKKKTEYGSNIYFAKNTPFDTLLICKEDRKSISDTAVPLLKSMEEANEVYTLIYDNNVLFVSPRKKEEVSDKRQTVGGGPTMHYLDRKKEEFINDIKRLIPKKGEYNWERFY